MIKLENLSKSYGTNQALSQINLTISRGDTTILIGPSGCGKSTLIPTIIGLIKPDMRQVYIDDTVLGSENVNDLRRKIGYVIQEGGLFPHLTARHNVAIMARHLGWEKPSIEKRIREIAQLTKFPLEGLDRYPLQLSGGQKQRISLMRALMLDPDILLLDEPLGALDPLIRFDLQTDLKAIFKELKKTVLLVTHDIGEASYFGDRIVLLHNGKIVQQGSIKEFVHHPAHPFVTQFIQAQRNPLDNSEDT